MKFLLHSTARPLDLKVEAYPFRQFQLRNNFANKEYILPYDGSIIVLQTAASLFYSWPVFKIYIKDSTR